MAIASSQAACGVRSMTSRVATPRTASVAVGDRGLRLADHLCGERVDPADVDPGLPDRRSHRHARVESQQVPLQHVGEVASEGRDQHSRSGLPTDERACSMQDDDGLARARAAGDARRTVVVAVDEPALLRVEEDSPCPEVALVDDALELLVGLDPREGELAGRLLAGPR